MNFEWDLDKYIEIMDRKGGCTEELKRWIKQNYLRLKEEMKESINEIKGTETIRNRPMWKYFLGVAATSEGPQSRGILLEATC